MKKKRQDPELTETVRRWFSYMGKLGAAARKRKHLSLIGSAVHPRT